MTEVDLPPDKSIAHRALLLTLVTGGTSRIGNVGRAGDVATSIAALRALGAEVAEYQGGLTVRSPALGRLRRSADPVDCGNSGTTARMLLGILAPARGSSILDGDASLRRRPMTRVTAPLGRAGGDFRWLGQEGRLPVEVRGGSIAPLDHRSDVASAQVKSALLLAGAGAGVPVRLTEPERSRDHTERMLVRAGMDLASAQAADGGWRVHMEHGRPEPLDTSVPGDPSAAAFLLALAALGASGPVALPGAGVNPTRVGFIRVMRDMGVPLTISDEEMLDGEPVATLSAAAGSLRGVAIGSTGVADLIDEIPVLAVLAARAQGETRIRGAAELRVKESDRLSGLASNLQAVGVRVEEQPDGLVIEGTDRPLSGRVRSFGDHRLAMAFAVLAAQRHNHITIDDMDVASISFPAFGAVLAGLARTGAT